MKSVSNKKQLIVIIVDVLVLVAGFLLKPATDFMFGNLPSCIFYDMGFVCPSCGGTRCISNIASGNFFAAWNYHPYFFCIFVYVMIGLIFLNLGYLFKLKCCENVFEKMIKPMTIIVLVVGFVIFGLIRCALIDKI